MMGEPVGRQDRLFYEFDLEELVPGDHLLLKIDAVLDLGWLRGELRPHYSHTGCPSVCPELMVRMLLVGYCTSIRSERRLCQEVELNLAYRWFCGLGLEDKVPHHSTFSVNRLGRFRESDILRKVFEEVVCACMAAGLVGGEGFAVDASVIEADASRFQRIAGSEVDWTPEQRASRPVQEYLAAVTRWDTLIDEKKNECRRSTNKDHCEDQLAELEEQKADALEALEDRRSQAVVAAAPATQSASVEARLAELKGLLERGVITPDEYYHAKRSQILSEL